MTSLFGYLNAWSVAPGDVVEAYLACAQPVDARIDLVQLGLGEERADADGVSFQVVAAVASQHVPLGWQETNAGSCAVVAGFDRVGGLPLSGTLVLGFQPWEMTAGDAALVRAASLQNRGIGRGMKVGKESIAGVMGALQAWMQRDPAAIRRREDAALHLWQASLQEFTDLSCACIPDPTGNPLQRLRVRVLPGSRWTARTLADALANGDPPVMVRDYQTDLGHIDLDPCNLHAGEAETVARQLATCLRR